MGPMEIYFFIYFLIFGRWVTAREIGCTSSEDWLGCSAYYFKTNNDCLPLNLAQRFPRLYSLDGNTHPERPKQLSLTPFEKRYSNNKYYSGVKVSIQPPTTAGVNYVKGFELSYSGTNLNTGQSEGEQRCIIFNFTIDKLNSTFRSTNFSVEVSPVGSGLWAFTAYSLPKPPTEEDTTDMFRQSSLVVRQYGYNRSVASKYWYTTISYNVDFDDNDIYGSIIFSFVGSPVYDFMRYKVQLFRINEEHPSDDMLIAKDDVPGDHVFQRVHPGKYKIKITPDHPDRFACQDEHGFPTTCTVTSTPVITFGDLDQTATTTSDSDHKDTQTKSSTGTTHFSTSITIPTEPMVTNHPEDSSGKIWAAVLGVALGILLIAITAYCMYQRRRKNHSLDDDSNNTKSSKISANCFQIPTDEMENKDKDKMGADHGEETLLLTYHAVNNYHDYAVQKLSDYLLSKICWNVKLVPCSMDHLHENSTLRKTLQTSCVVVIISSPDNVNNEQLSNEVQSYVRGALEARNDSVYKILPKLVRVSFNYHMSTGANHNTYSIPNEFNLMSDIQKLLEFLSMSGIKQKDANTLDRKGQKSKLNDLEKAVNLAVQYYRENLTVIPSFIHIGNMVEQIPDSYDSGYHERQPSLEESTQPQKLDSISNVLEKNRRLHTLDTTAHISDHYVMKELYPSVIDEHPSMPFQFHEPSEVFSTNDVSTLVMQQEICDFNERNLNPNGQLYFPKGSGLDATYSGRYDDECISVGSGKSV